MVFKICICIVCSLNIFWLLKDMYFQHQNVLDSFILKFIFNIRSHQQVLSMVTYLLISFLADIGLFWLLIHYNLALKVNSCLILKMFFPRWNWRMFNHELRLWTIKCMKKFHAFNNAIISIIPHDYLRESTLYLHHINN